MGILRSDCGGQGTLSGPNGRKGLRGTPRGCGWPPHSEGHARREEDAGVMGGPHSPLHRLTPCSPQTQRRGGAVVRPPQPFRAGTRPLSLPSRVDGRGGPRRAGWAAGRKAPTLNAPPRAEDGRETPQPGAGVGGWRRKSLRRSRRSPGLRVRRPSAGRERCPRSRRAFPPIPPAPWRCPGQQRPQPAARNSLT